MGTRKAADVARSTGIAPQTLDGYLRGAVPSADRAFALAEALGIHPLWLVKGDGPKSLEGESDGEWLTLPRYDLVKFRDDARPEPVEMVKVRREWISHIRTSGRLWVTELISGTVKDFGRHGDLVLCEDVTPPLRDSRLYIFLFDGHIIVRLVTIRPEGLTLIDNGGMTGSIIPPERLEDLYPIGRVLGSIGMEPV